MPSQRPPRSDGISAPAASPASAVSTAASAVPASIAPTVSGSVAPTISAISHRSTTTISLITFSRSATVAVPRGWVGRRDSAHGVRIRGEIVDHFLANGVCIGGVVRIDPQNIHTRLSIDYDRKGPAPKCHSFTHNWLKDRVVSRNYDCGCHKLLK